MIIPSGAVRVLVAMRPVDFRKGMDGLAAVVRESLGSDPEACCRIVAASFVEGAFDQIGSRPSLIISAIRERFQVGDDVENDKSKTSPQRPPNQAY